jgi:hypothetical protein
MIERLHGLLCIGYSTLGLAYLIAAALLQKRAIRATAISQQRIRLTNVALGFVRAVETREQDDWDYERQGRRPRPRRAAYDEGRDEWRN